MNESFSLIKYLQQDPDFSQALQKKTAEVKKDKANLLEAANQYTKKYQSEIEEGDRLRNKMLTEGKKQGLSEEQIFQGSSKFLPTVQTPILNFLYFIMRDEIPTKTIEETIQEYINKFGFDKSEITELYLKGIADELPDEIKNDEITNFEDSIHKDLTDNPQEMDSYLFENLGHELIKKIRKLKALSHSKNPHESALAYKKCRELCDEYHVDFTKIRCEIED